MVMKPIKKDMPLSNALFPFQLVFQDTKMPESELPDHLHEWHEIVYVYGGNGVFFIDNSFHSMDKGNLFFIPANTIHRALPDSTNPVTSTAIFFGSTLLNAESFGDRMPISGMVEEWRTKKVYKVHLTSLQQKATEHRLEVLQAEMSQENFGYRQAIALEIQQMLLVMTREAFSGSSNPGCSSESVGPRWITKALRYIDTNLNETIYLGHLADIANVSQPYFSKIFKQMTGLNLTEYITTKRIVRAKQLLEMTDDTVACVSEDCGFYSLPHFHRTFLKYTGMTPATYRKQRKAQT